MLNPVLVYNDYSIFHRTGCPVMSCCGARNFLLAIRFAKFRPLPLLFAPFIRHRRRSQTSPLRYLSVFTVKKTNETYYFVCLPHSGGASDGNRTRVFGLGSGHSTIELHSRILCHFLVFASLTDKTPLPEAFCHQLCGDP